MFLASVIVPLLILRLVALRGKFGNDGLPLNTTTTIAGIMYLIAQFLGVIMAIISLGNAIPATFTPALWALSKVTGCE